MLPMLRRLQPCASSMSRWVFDSYSLLLKLFTGVDFCFATSGDSSAVLMKRSSL